MSRRKLTVDEITVLAGIGIVSITALSLVFLGWDMQEIILTSLGLGAGLSFWLYMLSRHSPGGQRRIQR